MCLVYSAGMMPDTESSSSMQAQSPPLAAYVKQYLNSQGGAEDYQKNALQIYLSLIQQLLPAAGCMWFRLFLDRLGCLLDSKV